MFRQRGFRRGSARRAAVNERWISPDGRPRLVSLAVFHWKHADPVPSLRRMKFKTFPGFTLTELLVVVAIVAALAAMLLVVMGKVYEVIRSWD
jgi:prepilin-type N-terminal cleavage/methylation domain-containing protein